MARDRGRVTAPGASWEATFASLRRAASKHESSDRIRRKFAAAGSDRWGRIRCEVRYAIKCKYAIALYELVALRVDRERCVETMSLQTFRDKRGAPPPMR